MGVIRNAANTMIRGRVGQTTFYISGGQQIARQSRNDSNYGETARRSISQQQRRIMWANLVNFYKASAGWMKKAFESKLRNQTDYNKFMQLNMDSSRIALTKSEAASGACVVDGFLVSQGSLPSIEIVQTVSAWRTNIATGDLTIDALTTVGEFTEAVIAANANIHNGQQLSFVQYMQSVDPLGTPRVICRCYEVTLDKYSTEKLRTYMPEDTCTIVDGYIGCGDTIATGGFAWILSELVGGALRVSTQQLITNNATLIQQFTDSRHVEEAVSSYGLDAEVVLSPSSTTEQQPEENPLYISGSAVLEGSTQYTASPGTYVGTWGRLYGNKFVFMVNNIDTLTCTKAKLYDQTGFSVEETEDINKRGIEIQVGFSQVQSGSARVIAKVELLLSNDTVLTAEYLTVDPEGE